MRSSLSLTCFIDIESTQAGSVHERYDPARPRLVIRRPPITPQQAAGAIADIDPLRHLPQELHEHARMFLAWLEFVSVTDPEACPQCGSTKRKRRIAQGPRSLRNVYTCYACARSYNSLTGTGLEGMRHAYLWHVHMTLRFAGWSIIAISDCLMMSVHGTSGWDSQFMAAMQDRFPQLHQWWSSHQSRDDLTMPERLQQQADDFIAWVEAMSKSTDCLEGNLLERMAYRSRWVPFARFWLRGAHDTDMQREFGMPNTATRSLRARYEQAAREHYPELLQWVAWQRTRRHSEVRVSGRADTTASLGKVEN